MKIDFNKLEIEWQEEYKKYREEKELHRISFILTKKCDCKSNECRHYESEIKKLFKKKINRLLYWGIMNNAMAWRQAIQSDNHGVNICDKSVSE